MLRPGTGRGPGKLLKEFVADADTKGECMGLDLGVMGKGRYHPSALPPPGHSRLVALAGGIAAYSPVGVRIFLATHFRMFPSKVGRYVVSIIFTGKVWIR